jgi:NAD(P)-dependent dehydrogenase (short-subunit alcohol dehydrogenase family)
MLPFRWVTWSQVLSGCRRIAGRIDERPTAEGRGGHAITGLTKATALDGRAHDIACGQIDIGNAATALTEAMAAGMPQADGSVRPEPRIDVADVARAVCYMASLPLDANIAGHYLLGPARRGRLLGSRRFGYGADVKRTGRRARPVAPAVAAFDQE